MAGQSVICEIAPRPRDTQEARTPWEVHVGPMTFRDGNMELRPQMKLGGEVGHFKAEAGFSDVRDGLRFEWGCRASADAKSTGHSLEKLHENIRLNIKDQAAEAGSSAASAITTALQTLGLDRRSCADTCASRQAEAVWSGVESALERAQVILGSSASSASSGMGSIAESLGVSVADLNRVLSGAPSQAEGTSAGPAQAAEAGVETNRSRHEVSATCGAAAAGPEDAMSLRIVASAGLAVCAKMCLGWCDTQGYRMVGAGGKVDSVLSLGGEVFAGWHSSGVGMRIVLGIGHFSFEYDFPRAVRPRGSVPGQ